MNLELDRVSDQASLLDRELDAHAAAIAAATSPAAVDVAEAAHGDAMAPRMGDLDHMLVDMMTYCRQRQSQERGRTHDMQSAVASMRAELERHRSAPRADLVAARAEEEKHLRETRGIMTRLRDAGTAMRHEAGFYRCQHSNH
ncbi:MAG: hypothetical protein JST00_07080 [Deltaproteobacteria bacterium]|nr:hypothetical protein [Deltaproteobacteria bacterium]